MGEGKERDRRLSMQAVFLLGGIAILITGLNGSRPLVFVGIGMIVLALVGRFMGRKP